MLRLLVLFLFFVSSCREEDGATFAAAPAYQTLRHPDYNGAFFQFEHQGDRYLACSIHQAHLKPGAQLFRDGDQKPVTLGKKVHTQKDLHVWTFTAPSSEPDHFLTYLGDPGIKINDRIYFLNRGEKIPARVVALPAGNQFRHTYQTDKPFAAAGLSGSPVYLPRTGTVIGVLQTANDKRKATLGGFEILNLR